MTIAKLARRSPDPVTPLDSVWEAARRMKKADASAILVVDDDGVVGIMTEQDVVRRVAAQGSDPTSTCVGDAMSHPVESIDEDVAVAFADALMNERSHRHLVVLDSAGEPVGVLDSNDVLRRRADVLEQDVRSLERIAETKPGG
jgi:CBS domain-containing protein